MSFVSIMLWPGQGRVFEKAHYFSVFAQDKWKISRRVTLTAGVRYDREEIPVPERNNPEFASEDDYPIDGNNIQPRVGVSAPAWASEFDVAGPQVSVTREEA